MTPEPKHPSERIENNLIVYDFSQEPQATSKTPPTAAPALLKSPPTGVPTATAPDGLGALSIRSVREIRETKHDPEDLLLQNGYLLRGYPTVLAGMGGVGKSRLMTQLALCCCTGRDFLGWETNAAGKRWLFLQAENSTRRLKMDLDAMVGGFTPGEQAHIDEHVFFHTLEAEFDGHLVLGDLDNRVRITDAIERKQPDLIVYDPLGNFANLDLNGDHGMRETLRVIRQLTRVGNPQRTPIVVHHALTGRLGVQRVIGHDRTSFTRNSKTLRDWSRALINLAPMNPNNCDQLVIASGKNNDFPEFAPFCIQLNSTTMMYERDDSVDLEKWHKEISSENGGRYSKGKGQSAEDLLKLVEVGAGQIAR